MPNLRSSSKPGARDDIAAHITAGTIVGTTGVTSAPIGVGETDTTTAAGRGTEQGSPVTAIRTATGPARVYAEIGGITDRFGDTFLISKRTAGFYSSLPLDLTERESDFQQN